MINANAFGERLTILRQQKGVSARDMSLSLGQNAGYINNIENGKSLPSMTVFFYICEYLNVSPSQFFDFNNSCPTEVEPLTENLKKLNQTQRDHIAAIVEELSKS